MSPTCTPIISNTNPRSLTGPTWTSKKLRMVKLVAESIWFVFGWVVSCVSRNVEKSLRDIVVRREGGRAKSIVEGVRSAVVGLGLYNILSSTLLKCGKPNTHRGIRCLGHGTSPNNCGQLSRKLNTCGIKNKSSVFEKWPWIPTTANAMPLK